MRLVRLVRLVHNMREIGICVRIKCVRLVTCVRLVSTVDRIITVPFCVFKI